MKNENIEDIIFKNLIKTEKEFLKILGIKEHLTQCLNTELEVIPNKILHPDLVFDTTEEKIIHIEFQSTYNLQENYKRFCAYDSLLDLKYNKEIETIIIYTCNIKNPKKQLKRGNITYQPRIITFKNKNSDTLFKNIENKIKYNQEITQEEFMELVYTIFMGGTTSLKERIHKIIDINKKYNKTEKLKNNIILTTFNFSKKILDKKDFEELKNEMSIHAAVKEIYDEGKIKGIKEGKKEGIKEGIEEEKIKIAKNLIRENYPTKEIIKITNLTKKEIEELQKIKS